MSDQEVKLPTEEEYDQFMDDVGKISEPIIELGKTRPPAKVVQALVFCIAKTTHDHFNGDRAQGIKFSKRLGNMYSKVYRAIGEIIDAEAEENQTIH